MTSFVQHADTYDDCVGIACRAVCYNIVKSLGDLPENAVACDNACGTGAVTRFLLESRPSAHVYATDYSAQMIDLVEKMVGEKGWEANVTTQVGDSVNLSYADNIFDVHLMCFAIFFTADPAKTASEIYRTTKKGGVAVLAAWKQSGAFDMLWDVQDVVKPANPVNNLPMFERWRKPKTLRGVLELAGFDSVEMREDKIVLDWPTLGELEANVTITLQELVRNHWTNDEINGIGAAVKQVIDLALLRFSLATLLDNRVEMIN